MVPPRAVKPQQKHDHDAYHTPHSIARSSGAINTQIPHLIKGLPAPNSTTT